MIYFVIIIGGLITTYFTLHIEYTEGKISRKKIIRIIPPLITFALLCFTNINSFNEKKMASENSQIQMLKNDTLRREVEKSNAKLDSSNKKGSELSAQNDSIKGVLSEVYEQNKFLHTDLGMLRSEQKKGFDENDRSISDISKTYGSRHLNSKVEQELASELSQFKCSVTMLTAGGNQEITAFADQLTRIFKKAGWKTENGFGFKMYEGIPQNDIYLISHPTTSNNTKRSMLIIKNMIQLAGYKVYYIDDKGDKWKDVGKWIGYDENEFNIVINPYTEKIK